MRLRSRLELLRYFNTYTVCSVGNTAERYTSDQEEGLARVKRGPCFASRTDVSYVNRGVSS